MKNPGLDPDAESPPQPLPLYALIFIVALLCGGSAKTVAAQEGEPLPPGTYRLEMILASTTKLPFFGTSRSASKSLSLVDIRRDGERLMQSHRVCDFRVLEDSAMIKMVFPDKFIAALGRHRYPIQLHKDAHGWAYRADLGIERIGYRGNGENELPAEIDDAAVFDWDGDGRPGATLKISVPLLPDGELYIVQRGQSILLGRVLEPGRIEGGIEVRQFEQRVLGARPGFLAKNPTIEPNHRESRFSLVRIAAGSTCDSLRDGTAK